MVNIISPKENFQIQSDYRLQITLEKWWHKIQNGRTEIAVTVDIHNLKVDSHVTNSPFMQGYPALGLTEQI